MLIFDTVCAFLLGSLSGMGIGGGGLLVIYLTFIRSMSQIAAQGLNLYFFIFASIAALFVHFKKRKINLSLFLALGLSGMPASLLGSLMAHRTDPDTLKKAFGWMLIFAGTISLFRILPAFVKNKKEKK
ncbi:MAG: sulfite exporter TauE/SafE family protein [Ruminococcaceae bacterium]|nr:sulfite exporter TauE/SafE family protein [Oscillospiraceae bacterium]